MAKKSKKPKGTLADQLKNIKVVTVEKKKALARQAEAAEAVRRAERDRLEASRPTNKTDEELFTNAFEQMEKGDTYSGKYGHAGDKWRPFEGRRKDAKHQESEDQKAREEVITKRDLSDMEFSIGGLDKRFDDGKYHKHTPQYTATTEDSPFSTPLLPKDSRGLREVVLDSTQKEVIKKAETFEKSNRVPSINLRGDDKNEALSRLETFIPSCFQRGDKFLRIIHGRGKSSAGDPVIKPAVLTWLEGPGEKYISGYAPEVNASGDYGSLLIEFRRGSTQK